MEPKPEEVAELRQSFLRTGLSIASLGAIASVPSSDFQGGTGSKSANAKRKARAKAKRDRKARRKNR